MTKLPPLGGPHDALKGLTDEIGRKVEGSSDAGVRIAADFLGMARGTLNRNLDADESAAELSFVKVTMLTDKYQARSAAVYLARKLGCELVGFRHGHHADTPYEALAHMVKEVGEGQGAAADFVRNPKKATSAQKRQTVKELDEAVEAILEMRQRVLDGGE